MEQKIVLERTDTSLRRDFRNRDPISLLQEVQNFLKTYEDDIKAGKFLCAGVLGFSPSTGTHSFTLSYSKLPR
jgi:hypothetical protein